VLFLDPWLFHGGDFGAEGSQHNWQGLIAVSAGVLKTHRVRSRFRQPLLQRVALAVVADLDGGGEVGVHLDFTAVY